MFDEVELANGKTRWRVIIPSPPAEYAVSMEERPRGMACLRFGDQWSRDGRGLDSFIGETFRSACSSLGMPEEEGVSNWSCRRLLCRRPADAGWTGHHGDGGAACGVTAPRRTEHRI